MSNTTDCRNCEDSDPGALHALDEFCGRDKCASNCCLVPPHAGPCLQVSDSDPTEDLAREIYGAKGGRLRFEDADHETQESYRAEARRHLDLEYATRLDGTTMPAPRVLPNQHCWCGGEVGSREPGDHLGLGCLADVTHDWHGCGCNEQLGAMSEQAGSQVVVSDQPPLVAGPYTTDAFICPHGVRWWIEPTGEQIAQWIKDGVE